MNTNSDFTYLDHELIENVAESVVAPLVAWANATIFAPRGGELKCEFPVMSVANACIETNAESIWRPKVLISFEILLQMYRDAFVYPIVAGRIERETDVISGINSAFASAGVGDIAFPGGIPNVPFESLDGPVREYAVAMANAIAESGETRISRNDVHFRFLLFELMLTWTFFHELSHFLQQHCMLDDSMNARRNGMIFTKEINQEVESEVLINKQAREILADAEGLHLTIIVLNHLGRFQHAAMYALLCSVCCMFQAFFNNRSATMLRVAGSHPHPVIRDDFIGCCWVKLVARYLAKDQVLSSDCDAAVELTYMSLRAATITALIRSHRVSERYDSPLPSYLELQSERNGQDFERCVSELRSAVEHEAEAIKKIHLCPNLFDGTLYAVLHPIRKTI